MEDNFYTYGMIKPDAMEHKEEIIKMIYDANLKVHYMEYDNLTDEIIDENYAHCIGKDFYPGMKENLKSGMVLKMLIFDPEGNAVSNYRKILGATDSSKALPDTIRGRFGNKKITYKNAAHGSGNVFEANMEIVRFFKENMTVLLDDIRRNGMRDTLCILEKRYVDNDKEINYNLVKASLRYRNKNGV